MRLLLLVPLAAALQVAHQHGTGSNRREWLRTAAAAAVGGAATCAAFPSVASADEGGFQSAADRLIERAAVEAGDVEPEGLVDVYFGCGCFWHVQHEMVEAERKYLGRGKKGDAFTARTGYAGGNKGAKNGKVCYHNALEISDYGELGHAEVVSLQIPPSKFGLFAQEYCKLFDREGNRPDQRGDRGPEYRNLVGVPGGSKGALAEQLVAASKAQGDRLDFAAGKGNSGWLGDGDARATVFVMDTNAFPFFVAEPYHQFHDGFAEGEDYPESYNRLGSTYLKEKRFANSGCPNGLVGLGIAGL